VIHNSGHFGPPLPFWAPAPPPALPGLPMASYATTVECFHNESGRCVESRTAAERSLGRCAADTISLAAGGCTRSGGPPSPPPSSRQYANPPARVALAPPPQSDALLLAATLTHRDRLTAVASATPTYGGRPAENRIARRLPAHRVHATGYTGRHLCWNRLRVRV